MLFIFRMVKDIQLINTFHGVQFVVIPSEIYSCDLGYEYDKQALRYIGDGKANESQTGSEPATNPSFWRQMCYGLTVIYAMPRLLVGH